MPTREIGVAPPRLDDQGSLSQVPGGAGVIEFGGRTFIPYGRFSYLCPSKTHREHSYLVDLENGGVCDCWPFTKWKNCVHLRTLRDYCSA